MPKSYDANGYDGLWDALVEAVSRGSGFAAAWMQVFDSGHEELPLTREADWGTCVGPDDDTVKARAVFRLYASSANEAESVARRAAEDAVAAAPPDAPGGEPVGLTITAFPAHGDWDEAVDAIIDGLEKW